MRDETVRSVWEIETRDGGGGVARAVADWASGRVTKGEGTEDENVVPRTVSAGAMVELREITKDTVRAVCGLQVAPAQRRFVAPNAVSLAEALFEPHAWYRAVVTDGLAVGFAMLYLDTEIADYSLWRLMIADGLQGRGYGRSALDLIVAHVRALPGATRLLVSWVPGPGSPEPFYLRFGFEPTGEIESGEIVAALPL
jgi:diamine N-acetyltransferase